ncbi:MAG: cytosine permease [Nitrosopumilus sp.]|nr:cytosine permease [Nitrosopumilus sp.]
MKFPRNNSDIGVNPIKEKDKILTGKDFFVLWSSLGVGLLVISAGSFIYTSNILDALFVIIVGSIIGSILLGLAGKIGSDHSIPSVVSMRPSFGIYGSYLLTILNLIQLIGWSTFEITILSKAASVFTQGFMNIDFYLWSIIFGIIIVIFGVAGPLKVIKQWLNKFAVWIVYGSAIIMLINLILFSGHYNPNLINTNNNNFDFFGSLDLVIAMPLSWLPLVADYNRFAKKSKNAFLGTFIGFSITNTLFYVIGVLLGINDVFEILFAIQTFFYGFILLVLIVDEIDNVFANIFSSAMSLKNMFNKINYKYLVIIFTVLSCILANVIPINQYESFLLIIGALFAPLFAIVLTDYYVIKRGKASIDAFYDKCVKFRISAFSSFFVGSLTYFIISPISPIHHENLILGSTIPSMAISVVSFLSIEFIIKKVKLKKNSNRE